MASTNAPAGRRSLRRVIVASSAGTLIEWYDFFIYGSLAVFFSGLFFPPQEARLGLLVSIAAFGTGFVVRPLGAVLFGRLGDRYGRKRSFLATLLLMGVSTSLVGVLPTYETIGIAAPALLVLLRLAQGLAVGGEYGGAATYVAEHAPAGRKGAYTSVLQTTATGGFLLSIGVVLLCRVTVGEAAFAAWGWRIPFLLSAVLVLLSAILRATLHESPEFTEMKNRGTVSRSPLRDTFADRRSVLLVCLVLFGLTGGLGVVWYTSQFYALYFLQSVLKIDFTVANVCIAVAALLSTPMYVVFGFLSDRHGRMTFVIVGLALSAIGYVPLYSWMQHAATTGGYAQIVVAVFLQMTFAAMVYGPTAALLTELFPPQIRYTGLSVAYHLGTGVFGGFTPLVALASTSSTGNPLSGLTYSITCAALTALVGVLFLRQGAATPLVHRTWERFADPAVPSADEKELTR